MTTIICPIGALAFNVIIQVLAFRLRRGAGFFRSIVEGFAAGLLAFVFFEVALFPGSGAPGPYLELVLLVNLPIYAALSYCAYNFIQLGQTSIRIRIYTEIALNPSGVSVEEMKREYDEKALLQGRLHRLVESGDLVETDGRYVVGRTRFLRAAQILVAAKRILLGKRSQFQ
jgi:hypothetical protein